MKTNLTRTWTALLAAFTLLALAPVHAGPGFALSFDGADDWVDTQAAVIPTSGDFTVECWAFCPYTTAYREILSQGGPGNAFYIGTSTAQTVRLGDGWASTGVAFPFAAWHHFAVVKSSTSTIFYLDGIGRATNAAPIANPAASTGLRLGRQHSSYGEYWPGQIDEVRVWNMARSADQIRTNLNRALTGSEANLAGYWRCDEGSGPTLADATSHGRTGTLLNAPAWVSSTVPFVPDATTRGATAIGLTNATLNGTVNPGNLPTTAWFEWGGDMNYGKLTVSTNLAATNAPLVVSAGITNLTRGLIYHFRLVATNSCGVSVSSDSVLSTTRTLPGVMTLQLNGADPLTNECHASFVDPGAVVCVSPANIAAGPLHNLALKVDGTVVGWGNNTYGEANGAAAGGNVVAIAAGEYHSLALKADGTVVGWGNNLKGQNNVPVSASNVVAIAAGDYYSLALKADGTVVGWGNNFHGQTDVPVSATNVVAIAAGAGHSLALKADGTVVGWGWNDYDQTNGAAAGGSVVAIAGGADHSLALKADGTVVGWGRNYEGQLNVPATATNAVAITAGDYYSLALKADGTVVGWGLNNRGQSNVPATATNVVAIAAGGDHSLALKADGTVVSWGGYDYDQTNVPASANALNVPVGVSGAVDANTPGTYDLTYSATDNLGVVMVTHRTVVVADRAAPVLTLRMSNRVLLAVGTPFVDPGATASDACAGDLTGSIMVTGTVNPDLTGSYTLTYVATDASGNTGTTNRVVWVTSAPSASGLSASLAASNAVAGTRGAQFNAAVIPNGLPTSVSFQYGLTTAYPTSVPVDLPASFASSNLVTRLDLATGFTFYWRVVASNSLGVTTSPSQILSVPAIYARGDFNGDGVVDQSELYAVLANYWPTSPWLQITNAAGLGSTNVTFALTNSTAGAFSVEYSTNLTDWLFLGPATPRYEFTDTNTPTLPQRFYRLRWP